MTSELGAQPWRADVVRTVLGDVEARLLGWVDYHEHLFQVSPLLVGDELDDEAASGEEARTLHEAGIGSMIEATPTGLGRDPEAVARISASTGLGVVHTSGAHRQEHYEPSHWLLQANEQALIDRFLADVRDGLPCDDAAHRGAIARGPDGGPVRAGLLKAGIGYWSISAFENRVLGAIAQVAMATGVPVMIHTEHGSAAWEVLEILATHGLAADRVILAHMDRNLDPGLHAELTRAGAYLGYDGMARHRQASDAAILDCLEGTIATGEPTRLLLGGDVARRTRYRGYGGMPGLDYLPLRFVPRVKARFGDELVELVLRANPARVLSLVGTGARAPR